MTSQELSVALTCAEYNQRKTMPDVEEGQGEGSSSMTMTVQTTRRMGGRKRAREKKEKNKGSSRFVSSTLHSSPSSQMLSSFPLVRLVICTVIIMDEDPPP